MSSGLSADKVQAFLGWTRDAGVIFTGIELRYCGPNVGFGFFATKQLRIYENVIKVPKSLMITSGLVADIPEYIPMLKACRLEPFEVLVLFFCIEKRKGRASSWHPYIDVLPSSFGTPLATCPDMRPEHLPASVRDNFLKQLDEVEGIYKKLLKILPDLDYDLFLWAWHTVNTRCIYVENKSHPLVDCSKTSDTIAVIPLVDMLNHTVHPQALPIFDKRSQTYVVNIQSSAVPEGDQIYVCYGAHDNAKLWLEYGFRLPENIHNRVYITTELFIALVKKIGFDVDDQHIAVLQEAGLPNTIYDSDESPSYGLKKNCQILRMNHRELLNWREKIYTYDSDDDEEESMKRDQLVYDILTQLITSLKSKAEGIDDKLSWLWQEQIDLLQRIIDNRDC